VLVVEGLCGWVRETADRAVASDPGLNRLRMASSGVLAMGSALAVEYGFARLTHVGAQGVVIAMLLGAVMAMLGSMGLSGSAVWPKVRMALCYPVAMGIGMLAGVAVAGSTDLMLSVFVVIMFVAVFVRRFGLPFFFYGFMLWMGYFFASFLHATLAMLPSLIAAVAVATGWVLALSVTVLRTNPTRTLARTLRAFGARARAVVRVCAQRLEAEPTSPRQLVRWRRRLHARQIRLAEAALMVEGWLGQGPDLAAGWSATALRAHLLDVQLAIDALVSATDALAADAAADGEVLAGAAGLTRRLARRDYRGAEHAARTLQNTAARAATTGAGRWWPARHLADAVLQFLELARRWQDPGHRGTLPAAVSSDFEPAVELAMGNLPGSAAVAGDVASRGFRWNPLRHLDLTTRQALQAALAAGLAILAGRELSSTRYYWAVIAAFIAFTGTTTRSETFIKATNRVLGTLAGLAVAVGLADLTAGNTTLVLVVILASMFCGFYLIRISYAYMIFFITIMIAQLYSVLHEFTAGLLVLRLEETAIGAAIGIAVAVVFVPLSTRDTVRAARDNLFVALADLLRAAAGRLQATGDQSDLDAHARAVDNRFHQLSGVAKPLARPLLWGDGLRLVNHRLVLYAACATAARDLAVGLRHHPTQPTPALAEVCDALTEAATGLTQTPPGHTPDPAVIRHLATADALLVASPPPTPAIPDPLIRPLSRLLHLLHELTGTPTLTETNTRQRSTPTPVRAS